MKRSILKKSNAFLVKMLAFLGFASIFVACEYGCPAEYGTPETSYVVKGKVIDKTTGVPISGIQVTFDENVVIPLYGTYPIDYNEFSFADTTDVNGQFIFRACNVNEHKSFYLKANDIDGAENGLYITGSSSGFTFEDAIQTRPQNGWFQGEFTKVIDIEMEEDTSK